MIDLLYGEAKCRAHAEPAWLALSPEVRGDVVDRSVTHPGVHPSRRRDRAVLVASTNDARAAQRRGYGCIALLEHGIGQSYVDLASGAYPGGEGREMVGLFLSPNEHAAARDRAAYPGARVEVVGCPRLDTLPKRGPGPAPVVAVSFHWHRRQPPEMRSAFRHYRDALPALAKRSTVLGHAHPMAAHEAFAFYEKAGIEVVGSFDDVCRRADVYVADNTSTLYEFASTSRPVVVLNLPEYRRDVEHGLRFWQAAGVGVNVESPAALPDAVAEALEDGPKRKAARKAALGIVYAGGRGASKRAAEVIVEWLA